MCGGFRVAAKEKAPEGAGESGKAVGEAVAGAPNSPAAVVLDVGVGSNEGGSTALCEALGVAAFDKAADDKGAVDVGAGSEHGEDAGDNGDCAGGVEVHLSVCVVGSPRSPNYGVYPAHPSIQPDARALAGALMQRVELTPNQIPQCVNHVIVPSLFIGVPFLRIALQL
jgi:hypothetical protein